MLKNYWGKLALNLGLVSLGVLLGMVGLTSAVDTSTPIHACVLKNVGTMRIVSSPTQCSSSLETPLQWNMAGAQGVPGLQGAMGEKGDTGLQGVPGIAGISGYEMVTNTLERDNPSHTLLIDCPPGKVVLGGGYNLSSGHATNIHITINAPRDDISGWIIYDDSDNLSEITGYAICATAS
jgi:hypothetical protein